MKSTLHYNALRVKKAFTLIELLVVIAIIAILAAILFPVFARARENARRSSCSSNMKQIGLGIIQYTQDYDEKYPARIYGTAPAGGGRLANSWRRVTLPYTKSTQIFSCPSNTHNADNAEDSLDTSLTDGGYDLATAPRFKRSYGINGTGNVGGTTPSEYAGGRSLSAITDSAGTILVAEYSGLSAHIDINDGGNFADRDSAFTGHLGNSNFLFCDGHVKALKPSATINATGAVYNSWAGEENDTPPAGMITDINKWQLLINKS